MNNSRNIFFCILVILFQSAIVTAQWWEELLPYGDMDQWGGRYITDSKLIGGGLKLLYAIGSNDTIRENAPYIPQDNNPWGCSNVYVKRGVETSLAGSVIPEKRGYGYACRIQNIWIDPILGHSFQYVGSIYWGQNIEPVGILLKSNPFLFVDFGVPFTRKPAALRLDYKAIIESTDSAKVNNNEISCNAAEILLYFQYRWEDASTGKIYARRVGTATKLIDESVIEWANNQDVGIRWGNITNDSLFNSYEKLNRFQVMSRNSNGKLVKVEEVGFSLDQPTHLILIISSNAITSQVYSNNVLWVDNLRWVYKEDTDNTLLIP